MPGFTTAFPNSLKTELARAMHDFSTGGDIFKCALGIATPAGTFGAGTTNYSQLGTDEIPNGSGYVTGGFAWANTQNITPQLGGNISYWSWAVNPSWPAATLSSSGCLIYNFTKGGKIVYVGSFSGILSVSAQNLNLLLPANAPATSILRLT